MWSHPRWITGRLIQPRHVSQDLALGSHMWSETSPASYLHMTSVLVWTRLYTPFPVPCSSFLCYSFFFFFGSVTGETFLSLRYSFSSLLEVIRLMPLIHRQRLREAFVEELDWAGPDPVLSLSAHCLRPYLGCVICLLDSQTQRTGTSHLTHLCIISSTKHISAEVHTSSI